MNVELLSGSAFTPRICLHDVIEQVDNIESICVVYKLKDGTCQTTLSYMKASEACLLSMVAERRIMQLLDQTSER